MWVYLVYVTPVYTIISGLALFAGNETDPRTWMGGDNSA